MAEIAGYTAAGRDLIVAGDHVGSASAIAVDFGLGIVAGYVLEVGFAHTESWETAQVTEVVHYQPAVAFAVPGVTSADRKDCSSAVGY